MFNALKRFNLTLVAAITFGVGFVALGYLNYYQHSQAQQAQSLLQGQITDLTYQVNQDHANGTASATPVASPSASPGASPQASPSPSSSPQVAGTATISLPLYKVNFTANDPITDVTASAAQDGSYQVEAFTSSSLLAKYPQCTAGVLGVLVAKTSRSASAGDEYLKTLGGYSYYYNPKPLVSASCATDSAGQTVISQDVANLSKALSTLSSSM